jgi:hypothetical protein
MALKQDSIYTPGKINLALKLTKEAEIEGEYHFNVNIYVAETLMRRQTLPARDEEPTVFELEFPAVRSRTGVRCRVELFLNGQFIETKEKPLALWPPMVSCFGDFITEKVIWVFDISGGLQQFFKDLKIEIVDATFQAARDFGIPDIILVGQDTDPNNMQVIIHRLMSVGSNPVVVFFRQKQLPKNATSEITIKDDHIQKVVCEINSPLLAGLNKSDIMNMLDDAMCVKVRKGANKDISIDSYVTKVVKNGRNVYSYLCTVTDKGQVTIYCQLNVTEGQDPRSAILLANLLRFADRINDSQDDQTDFHGERR